MLVIRKAVQFGFDRELLLSRSNLSPAELSDPDTRIPREKLSRLWIAIEEEYKQPFFGIEVGKSVTLEDLGILGYAMRHSETLGHAMAKLEQFGKLLSDDVAITVELGCGAPQIRLDASIQLIAIRHPIHCRLAIVVAIARELTSPELSPRRIHIPELLTKDAVDLSEFFQCQLTSGEQQAIVVFEEADWKRRIDDRDPKLESYLNDYANHLIEKRPDSDNLVAQIEFALSSNLAAGEPGLISIAKYLGMSVRSLQRRLTAAQTSYKQVLDDFRRTQALDFLSDRRYTIQEVAKYLGYHEPSGFYRAFHRWMGCTPNQYRDHQAIERR
ncbi:MAG: AraC family transcriptional regulator [Verrucomicrobiota bacterium]